MWVVNSMITGEVVHVLTRMLFRRPFIEDVNVPLVISYTFHYTRVTNKGAVHKTEVTDKNVSRIMQSEKKNSLHRQQHRKNVYLQKNLSLPSKKKHNGLSLTTLNTGKYCTNRARQN